MKIFDTSSENVVNTSAAYDSFSIRRTDRCKRKSKTRKFTRPKRVENDASARPPNLSSALCGLDL